MESSVSLRSCTETSTIKLKSYEGKKILRTGMAIRITMALPTWKSIYIA
ncbi:MAG: hypothetical protein MUC93_03330 [Bacteroidales bacterium]|nr:hypothetical protein [Bacteroidales bacterium]